MLISVWEIPMFFILNLIYFFKFDVSVIYWKTKEVFPEFYLGLIFSKKKKVFFSFPIRLLIL